MTPQPGGSVDNPSTCRKFVGIRLFDVHAGQSHSQGLISLFFSYKHTTSHNIIQDFDIQLFYKPKYVKIDFPNIFYKHSVQGHNPTLFTLTASKERRPLVYLKG